VIIINLQGGLGNQMFQYAYARFLVTLGYNIKLNQYYFNNEDNLNTKRELEIDKFNITIPIINKSNEEIGYSILNEKTFSFDDNFLKLDKSKDYILQGYWQSYKYFDSISKIIKQELKPKNIINLDYDPKLVNTTTIGVHVRRGDYINNEYHGECSKSYYYNAISYLLNFTCSFPIIYFFSDDIEWCQEEFSKIEYSTIFFSNKNRFNDVDELMVFSNCRFKVIANSSYSWWAAYLGNYYDGRTVAPKYWFKKKRINNSDLFLDNWKVIDSSEDNEFGEKINRDYRKVSIIIPVYNGEKYIQDTLNSLYLQTFKNFEIISVDDGSTDKTLDILYKNKIEKAGLIPHLIIRHFKNKNLASSRNTGFKYCNGNSKYIMSHDSDDISYPEKLEKLVDFLEEHPDISIVGTLGEYFKDNDIDKIVGNPPIKTDPKEIHDNFHITNHVIVSSALCRIEVWSNICPFNEEYDVAEDYEFWCRALRKGYKIQNLNEVLHKIRLHSKSLGSEKKDHLEDLRIKISNQYKSYLDGLNQVKVNLGMEKKDITVGVLQIATGKLYYDYSKKLIESAGKYFLTNYNLKFFLFTDMIDQAKEELRNQNVKIIYQQQMKWPGPTLLRYYIFYKNRDIFKDCDYLYYCDADMLFVDFVGEEVLGDRVATLHPGFYMKLSSEFPLDQNTLSKAYINPNEINTYFAGGFNGGKKDIFLSMCLELSRNIIIDLSKGIIAVWDDESHMNKYFLNNSPTVILTPEYCYADDEHHKKNPNYPKEGKLIALDKKSKGLVRHYEREKNFNALDFTTSENLKEIIENQCISLKLKSDEKFSMHNSEIIIPCILDNIDKRQNLCFLRDYLNNKFNVKCHYFIISEKYNELRIKDCFKQNSLNLYYYGEGHSYDILLNNIRKILPNINGKNIIYHDSDCFLEYDNYINFYQNYEKVKDKLVIPYNKILYLERKYLPIINSNFQQDEIFLNINKFKEDIRDSLIFILNRLKFLEILDKLEKFLTFEYFKKDYWNKIFDLNIDILNLKNNIFQINTFKRKYNEDEEKDKLFFVEKMINLKLQEQKHDILSK